MFVKSDEYAIKRRKPHAKAISRLGTLFFLLAIAWLVIPVVFAQLLLLSLLSSTNGDLVTLIYLGVEAVLIILAFTFWITSITGQKGTLTVFWNRLHFQFKNKSIDVSFDDIYYSMSKKNMSVAYYRKKNGSVSPTHNLNDRRWIEFKSKDINDIYSSIRTAYDEYLEWKHNQEEEWKQRLSAHNSGKSE